MWTTPNSNIEWVGRSCKTAVFMNQTLNKVLSDNTKLVITVIQLTHDLI